MSLAQTTDTAVIDLQLLPAVSVSGMVVDESGKPVEEALVVLPPSRTLSAADGSFTLTPVREGKHVLRARHAHFDQFQERIEVGSEGLNGAS